MINNPLFSEFLTALAAAVGQNKNCVGGNGGGEDCLPNGYCNFFFGFSLGRPEATKGRILLFSIIPLVYIFPSRHRKLLNLFYFCNRSSISSGRWVGVLRLPHFSILHFFSSAYYFQPISLQRFAELWTFHEEQSSGHELLYIFWYFEGLCFIVYMNMYIYFSIGIKFHI
jgi:hypothetical protein